MNHYYQYKYKNGLQFVSTATPLVIEIYFKKVLESEIPMVLGRWRFKNLTNKHK